MEFSEHLVEGVTLPPEIKADEDLEEFLTFYFF